MAENQKSNLSDNWHLDKKVPIALILAILLQTAAFVWQIAEMKFRIDDHDRRLLIAEAVDTRRDKELAGVGERLARLEEQSRMQVELLRRIEQKMDRAR
jgi:hypothetical protein